MGQNSRTTPKCFLMALNNLGCGNAAYLVKILTFHSFPGPLLPETLAVRDIPPQQRANITICLSGKVTRIAFFLISKVSTTIFQHLKNKFAIYLDDFTIENNGFQTMKLSL